MSSNLIKYILVFGLSRARTFSKYLTILLLFYVKNNSVHLNSFQWIIIKLCDIVCWHNLMAKRNNQPDPLKDLWLLN